jgi:hypothetical protein
MQTPAPLPVLLLAALLLTPACDRTATSPEADSPPDASTQPSLAGNGRIAPVARMSLNGEVATYRAVTYGFERQRWVTVHVDRSGAGANAETRLFFIIQECDGQLECTSLAGIGSIPPGDFRGNLQRGYTLWTDTRTNPDFNHLGSSGGVISIRWTPDGAEEVARSGRGEDRWYNLVRRWSGTERFRSARTTAEVLDVPTDDSGLSARGWIGESRGVQQEFFRSGEWTQVPR